MDIKNRILITPGLLSYCIFLLAVPADAGIFKCVTPNGSTAYQQGPCAAEASSKLIDGTLSVAPVANRAEIRKNLAKKKRKSNSKSPTLAPTSKNESAYARRMRLQKSMVKGEIVKGMDRKQVARALSKMKKTGDSGSKNYGSETYRGKDGASATVRYGKDGFVEQYHTTKNR